MGLRTRLKRRPRLLAVLLALVVLASLRLAYYSLATLREDINRGQTPGSFPIIVLQITDDGSRTVVTQAPEPTTPVETTQSSEENSGIDNAIRLSLGDRQRDAALCQSAVAFLRNRYSNPNSPCVGSSGVDRGYRELLLSKLVDIVWTRWSDQFEPNRLTVLSTPQMVPASLVVGNPMIVPALRDEYLLVVEHCAEVQWPTQYIEVSDVLSVPGYVHFYHTIVRCGTRCGSSEYYVFIDVPLPLRVRVGDMILGHQLWRIYLV